MSKNPRVTLPARGVRQADVRCAGAPASEGGDIHVAKRAIKVDEHQVATVPSTAGTGPTAVLTNLVVLAEDSALIEVLKNTLEGRQRIWRADSAVHAADLLLASQNGVLLVDCALGAGETPTLVEQLHAQFPDLPVIVTGRRDDETLLGALISSGAIYRFLHKPVSAERIRTFIEAAERRLTERPVVPAFVSPPAAPAVPASDRPRRRLDPLVVRRMLAAAAAVGLVALLVAGVAELVARKPWQHIELPSLPTPPSRPEASAATDGAAPAPAPAARADANVARLLSLAGIALSQGRLVEPEGQNAVELYRMVLLEDPGNEQAATGLALAAGHLLTNVEQALAAGDLSAAAAALDAARSAAPDNPLLETYSTRLALAREAGTASERRAAGAVDEAARAIDAEVARLLTLADSRMREGRLVGGANSAESYVLAARRSRPDDPGVRQALNALSGRMLLAASQAIVEGDTPTATTWIDRADTLGVDGKAVARLRAEIESQRIASVREDHSRLLALANQRIAQGRLLEPGADSARHYLDLLRAAAPDYPGLAETQSLLAGRLLAEADELTEAGRLDEAAARLAAAAAAGAATGKVAPLRAELDGAVARREAAGSVLPENSLKRIAHTPAGYPSRAASRGVEGWVEVRFTVLADGTTRDAQVVASSPEGYFEQSVLDAVAQWRYEPRIVGGKAVDQLVEARLRFQLSER